MKMRVVSSCSVGMVAALFLLISGCAPIVRESIVEKVIPPGQTYLAYHQILDAGDLDKAMTFLASLKTGELEGKSDDDVLAELRVLYPVEGLALVSEPVEGDRSTVTVRGTAMGMTATGTISMVMEAGHWKLLGEQWNLGGDPDAGEPVATDATLHEAAKAGDTEKVVSLIKSGVDVNARDSVGRTPLIWAVNYGHTAAMSQLIEAGADVNAGTEGGETPPMIATGAGEPDALEILIQAGADVHATDRIGRTALLRAAMISDWIIGQMDNGESDAVRMIRALIGAGADVNSTYSYMKRTALMDTSLEGRSGMVRALLDADADVNRRAVDDITAIMEAAKAGHRDIVKMLMDAGADLAPKDLTGRTVLDWAADSPEIVEMLRAKGAKGKAPRKSRQSAKTLPTPSPEQKQQAEDKLRAKGYSEISGSLFLNAATKGDVDAVRLFLEAGIPVDYKDDYDHVSTALNRAVSHLDSPDTALLLIRSGANVEAGLVAPLINAAENCNFKDVVRALIEAGADVNAKAPGGATPLMMATIYNCDEIAKILREAGAEE